MKTTPAFWTLLLLGALFAAAGAWLLPRGLDVVAEGRASVAWPEARGTVIRSEVVRERATRRRNGTNRVAYRDRAEIRYRYEVDGVAYEGDRVRVVDYASRRNRLRLSDPAADTAQRYPLGAEVTVRHAPADPARALLEPGLDLKTSQPLLYALGLFALALGSLVGAIDDGRKAHLRERRAARRAASAPEEGLAGT